MDFALTEQGGALSDFNRSCTYILDTHDFSDVYKVRFGRATTDVVDFNSDTSSILVHKRYGSQYH